MPHFTIEYSANLDSRVDMKGLCDEVLRAALGTGLFEIGAPRVRAVRCEAYAIADNQPENAFIDILMRVGNGRPQKAKKEAGDAIFAAAEAYLAPLLETQHFALSFEIREIDADLSWRRNAIHSRLRGK